MFFVGYLSKVDRFIRYLIGCYTRFFVFIWFCMYMTISNNLVYDIMIDSMILRYITYYIFNGLIMITEDEINSIENLYNNSKISIFVSFIKKYAVCVLVKLLNLESRLSINGKYIIIKYMFNNSFYELLLPVEHVFDDTEFYDSKGKKIFQQHLSIVRRYLDVGLYETSVYVKKLDEDTFEYKMVEVVE